MGETSHIVISVRAYRKLPDGVWPVNTRIITFSRTPKILDKSEFQSIIAKYEKLKVLLETGEV